MGTSSLVDDEKDSDDPDDVVEVKDETDDMEEDEEDKEDSQSDQEESTLMTNAEDQIEREIRRRIAENVTTEVVDGESQQQFTDMITLSDLPSSVWTSIVHIDTIKSRNKPEENVVKAVEAAPFFLPTEAGVVPHFKKEEEKEEVSKLKTISTIESSEFAKIITEGRYSEGIDLLRSMSPSGVDYHIHMLSTTDEMTSFLSMLFFQLNENSLFELVQAYLATFLKHHSDTVLANSDIQEEITKLKEAQENHWKRLQSLFDMNACLLKFFSGIQ